MLNRPAWPPAYATRIGPGLRTSGCGRLGQPRTGLNSLGDAVWSRTSSPAGLFDFSNSSFCTRWRSQPFSLKMRPCSGPNTATRQARSAGVCGRPIRVLPQARELLGRACELVDDEARGLAREERDAGLGVGEFDAIVRESGPGRVTQPLGEARGELAGIPVCGPVLLLACRRRVTDDELERAAIVAFRAVALAERIAALFMLRPRADR